MTNQIHNQEDTIDSRDVIARIEDLKGDLESAYEDYETAYEEAVEAKLLVGPKEDFDQWVNEQADRATSDMYEEAAEYRALVALAEQGAGYGDWMHGDTLIRESYFTNYIEQLIGDCYELPKEMASGDWPWRHITVDYEAAAEEAKIDYTELDFDGETYLMRA